MLKVWEPFQIKKNDESWAHNQHGHHFHCFHVLFFDTILTILSPVGFSYFNYFIFFRGIVSSSVYLPSGSFWNCEHKRLAYLDLKKKICEHCHKISAETRKISTRAGARKTRAPTSLVEAQRTQQHRWANALPSGGRGGEGRVPRALTSIWLVAAAAALTSVSDQWAAKGPMRCSWLSACTPWCFLTQLWLPLR